MNENPYQVKYHFSPEEIISLYTATSTNTNQVINRVIESIELGIFNFNDGKSALQVYI